MSDHEGLTKPLINNVGADVDEGSPSADQLLGENPDASWSDTPVQEYGGHIVREREDDLFPEVAEPGEPFEVDVSVDATDRTPGGGPNPR